MTGHQGSQSGLTRRSFLKGTAAAAGAIGLAGAASMTSTEGWLAPATAHAEEPNEIKRLLAHQFHCLGGCGLQCTVRDGRIVQIEPHDFEDGTHGQCCLRGLNEVQHVYSSDRLQSPMKRVGERGEGKFVEISWEEAIKTVADAIKDAQSKYGNDSFMCRKTTEATQAHGFEFLAPLVNATKGGNRGIDRGLANGTDCAGLTKNGLAVNSIWEWPEASTVIHLGSNIMESGIVWSQAFFDAQDAGTTMITIDPRYTITASKSDQWVPIKPGTDAALLLSMIKLILDQEWYDEDHMIANTSLPFLVDSQTGKVLGKTEEKENSTTKKMETVKVPLVWDVVTNSPRYFNEDGVIAALEGTYSVDGVEAITEFSLLKERMIEYTPEWSSSITGLDESVIFDLADVYANGGPAVINYGFGGTDKYANADVTGQAISLLVALTGNSGHVGTGTGFYNGGGGRHSPKGLKTWTLPKEFQVSKTISMYDMPYKDNNVHAVLTFGDVFALEAASSNDLYDWVKSLDFFAICDIYHTTSVDYADIVLPCCTKFESNEEVSDLREARNNHLYLNQKCIDPLFESKEDLEIERLIAAEFGLDQHLPQSNEELARFRLSATTGNTSHITFEELKEKGGIKLQNTDSIVTAFANQVYPTDTGRVEVYHDDFVEVGQAFPQYESPNEVYADNPMMETYPLALMQGRTRFRIHGYYSASSWFRDYFNPSVNISPVDAEKRGIQTGDYIEVFNDRGSFICTALVNPSLQPGSIFMGETTYAKYYKDGTMQDVTNPYREERCYSMEFGPTIPFNDTLVDIRKA